MSKRFIDEANVNSLEDLFAPLLKFDSQIPLETLRDWGNQLSGFEQLLEPYKRFHGLRYQRNLIFSNTAFEALLICWQNGQRSPIHDHQGSHCVFRVIDGDAIETEFETAPNGMVYPTRSRSLQNGSICASSDSDIHVISNLQADDRPLVTLHVYSWPLQTMNVYHPEDGRMTREHDPYDHVFAAGAGI